MHFSYAPPKKAVKDPSQVLSQKTSPTLLACHPHPNINDMCVIEYENEYILV